MMPTAEQVESAGIGRQAVEALDAMEPQGEALALLGLIALRPGVARDLEGSGLLARTIERVIATGDPRLIEATAVAALTLVTGAPDTARQFPASARIAEAAAALEPAGSGAARALDRLARVLERNGA
jgi:predicted component of type VI protein secretion system